MYSDLVCAFFFASSSVHEFIINPSRIRWYDPMWFFPFILLLLLLLSKSEQSGMLTSSWEREREGKKRNKNINAETKLLWIDHRVYTFIITIIRALLHSLVESVCLCVTVCMHGTRFHRNYLARKVYDPPPALTPPQQQHQRLFRRYVATSIAARCVYSP